jgi:hypothetical protein
MPCYDPRNSPSYVREETKRESEAEINNLKDRVKYLEACLCATLSELERIGIVSNVVTNASRHGLVDLMSFWIEHKQDDKARLLGDLHKLSKDEQRIALEILKELDV